MAAPCNGRLVTVMAHRYVFRRGWMRQEETMGLLDVLNGMQNGPRGPSNPSPQTGGGMSPMTMAILALLAYKAVKHYGGSQPGASPAPAPSPAPSVNAGLPGGPGEVANSWVSPGPNKSISPGDLAKALGADQIDNLASQSGLSRDELLSGLSQHLPDVINHLTPDGRLPTESELSGRI